MITRIQAIANLQPYLGKNLFDYCDLFKIYPFKDGKQNKGWKGLILERLAGLQNNNEKAPNGLGFEMKSVAFVLKKEGYKAKETMAITMLNKKELVRDSFFESHCWEKLKSLVFCATSWEETGQSKAILLDITSFDFLTDGDLIKEIEQDYEFIRGKLITQGFESLTGSDGKWIQTRTKGAGHGSTSRAFYARPSLVNLICQIEPVGITKIDEFTK